ncbi:MAG: hypothetical protein ABMA00_14005 [Gemmatimonas sp.]
MPHLSMINRCRAPRPVTALALGLATMLAASACNRSSDSVTISGDVEGLDSIGLRGDSLLAGAGLLATASDSSAAGRGLGATSRASGDNLMTRRAHARGDSMARAEALRLVAGSATARSIGDTVRGVITLIGSEPQQVVLRPIADERTIALSGMATTGLSRLAGVELVIRGVLVTPRDVVVSSFLVRAKDGVPAFDGKLSTDGRGSFLTLTDGSGRKNIPLLPSPLRGLEGMRVWIAMQPGTRTATTYGVIGRR